MKSGSNMLIADDDCSRDENPGLDDDHRLYQEEGDDDKEYKPTEMSQEALQETDNTQDEQDDKTTDTDTEKDEEYYEGQLNDDDFEGIVFTQKNILCNVQEKAGIPASRILLDSQSTVDMFCNARLLHNIQEVKKGIWYYTVMLEQHW